MISSSRLRIAFLDHTAQLGGGEIALVNLVAQLDLSAVDPVVVLFADGPLRGRLEAQVPVFVCPLPASIGSTRKDSMGWNLLTRVTDLGGSLRFVLRLRRQLRTLAIDVVHTNSLKADVLGGVAARLAGIPVVWHVRDRIAPDYLPRVVVKVFRALAQVIPDHVIANSSATLATLCEDEPPHGKADVAAKSFRSRVSVVHDGVAELPTLSSEPQRPELVVGIVGRISPWKGQDVFLKAAQIVSRHYPSATFRIIGSALFGEEAFGQQLLRLRDDLGLSGRVEFTGFIDDVSAAIGELDILVHASTQAEPFGQVIIEGMAAAKPVIATKGGGVPEIVIHGVTGILVPMGDAQAMADALLRLMNDPAGRAAMGSRGRLRVREEFMVARTARNVERVYERMLGKQSSRPSSPANPRRYPAKA